MTRRLRLEDYLPYRLSVASNAVSRLIARAYESRFGLKIPEWRVLAVLAEHPNITQQQIALRTEMDKVTVSRAAQALARRRLILASPDAEDGRARRLSLSEEGQALYAEVSPAALALEADLLQAAPAADVTALLRQLRRLEDRARSLGGAAD